MRSLTNFCLSGEAFRLAPATLIILLRLNDPFYILIFLTLTCRLSSTNVPNSTVSNLLINMFLTILACALSNFLCRNLHLVFNASVEIFPVYNSLHSSKSCNIPPGVFSWYCPLYQGQYFWNGLIHPTKALNRSL